MPEYMLMHTYVFYFYFFHKKIPSCTFFWFLKWLPRSYYTDQYKDIKTNIKTLVFHNVCI